MHHAYNAYTLQVLDELVESAGFSMPAARAFLRAKVEQLYANYLNLTPAATLVKNLLSK